VDAESGSLQAIFLLDNPDLKLRPNMQTEFHITTEVREKVFSLPTSAIQGDRMSAHVFKRDYSVPHLFHKVPVVVGDQNHERTEIVLQGKELNVADEVVVAGGYLISHHSSTSSSLKEALDAAHGHEHNEDGSEITAEQKAKRAAEKAASSGNSSGVSSATVILLSIACIVLASLLVFTILRKSDVS